MKGRGLPDDWLEHRPLGQWVVLTAAEWTARLFPRTVSTTTVVERIALQSEDVSDANASRKQQVHGAQATWRTLERVAIHW